MKPKSKREKFLTRKFLLSSEKVRASVLALVRNLPIDTIRPLEVVVREEQKQRGLDQQALMWCGPLADMEAQLWVEGRKYSAAVLHEFFKREFLPEEHDPELTKDGYVKWEYTPSGDRVLVGSTTQLTVKGMAQYIEQLHAFGANMGVRFHASPNEVPMLREVG